MSGSRKNRPLRPFTWLLLLGALAFAAGCSTGNTPGGGGLSANHLDASGRSVPGWLVVPSGGLHAATATRNFIADGGSGSCAECHGSDLTGGISRVSCFGNSTGCHHVPVAGWVAPPPAAQNHGVSAKRAPGSSGFAACQICHGRDFSGGGAQVTCFNNAACHGATATWPHPPAPWRASAGSTYTHTDTNPSNAPVCAQCHQSNPGTPGCFNSTLCHGAAAGHPAGWVAVPPAPQPHGTGAKAANGFPGCQTCHGADFAGTASSGNVAAVSVKWEASLYGTACGAPPPPLWQRVLLKQPGGVPAGAGVGGWFGGLFCDPGKWQTAHTAAFPVSTVVVWVYVDPAEARHGAGACGHVAVAP